MLHKKAHHDHALSAALGFVVVFLSFLSTASAAVILEQPLNDEIHFDSATVPINWIGPFPYPFSVGATGLSATVRSAEVQYDGLSGTILSSPIVFYIYECADSGMTNLCRTIYALDPRYNATSTLPLYLQIGDPNGTPLTIDFTHAAKDLNYPNGTTTPDSGTFFTDGYTLDPTKYYQLQMVILGGNQDTLNLYGHTISNRFNPYFRLFDTPAVVATTTPTSTPTCTENCFSNVLFLPGIESSRLYAPDTSGERQLWEPSHIHSDDSVRALYLNDSGETDKDIYAKDGQVLDELPFTGESIYKSFLAKMQGLKDQHLINDWEPIAYDWRLSLGDILQYGNDLNGHIYYSSARGATSTPYIVQELRRLAASSKTGKVTIIAHSNGGLVAKKLTEVLGPEASHLIDKMIFVAVPQAGTPVAVAAGLHGFDQGNGPGGIVSSAAVARSFASTSPMFYHLLPSTRYFTYVDDPIITFDPALTDWISRYGSFIHSRSALDSFLSDSYGRVDSETGDLDQPTQLKAPMLAASQAVHDDLDNWTPPPGVQLIQIAGWGVPTTLTGITYKKKGNVLEPNMNVTRDGDGTVVVPSALWTSTTASTTNYWLDLKGYNKDNQLKTIFGYLGFDHSRILEVTNLQNFIVDVLTNSQKTLSTYTYISAAAPQDNTLRLRYSLHSPLTLDAYDSTGHHTGISTSTNQMEEGIPGTYFVQFGDIKYLFTDTDTPIHIIMRGYATSTFTFEADQFAGDTLQASTTWKDMPVTPQTKVTISDTSELSALSPLQIDNNGDGVIDYNLQAKLNDIVTIPKAPLTITADSKTVTLGDVLPPLTSTTTGYINGDSASSNDLTGSPSCSTSATGSNVGNYLIICNAGTLTSNTYAFSNFVPGTLNIIYRWDGFMQPINDTAHQIGISASVFKAGSTIPVKLQLKKIDGAIVQAAAAPQWLTPQKGGVMTAAVDESTYTDQATSGTSFKWDSTSQQYIYNWSTKGFTAGYWYKISVKLDDGKIYYVTIGLR